MAIHNLFGKGNGGNGDEPPVDGNKRENPKIESIVFTSDEPFTEFSSTNQRASAIQGGILIRWILLMFSFIAFFTLVIQTISATLTFILNVVTFFRNSLFREVLKRYWRGMQRWTVFTVGSIIGVVSPSLGLGFVVLYFALRSEQGRDDFFTKFFVKQYQGMGR
jgi:hypothetical protein